MMRTPKIKKMERGDQEKRKTISNSMPRNLNISLEFQFHSINWQTMEIYCCLSERVSILSGWLHQLHWEKNIYIVHSIHLIHTVNVLLS